MNLTGQSIASTYNTLVTLNGHVLTDGTGSQINSLSVSASWANNSISASYAPGSPSISASYALSASYSSPQVSSSYSATASYALNGGGGGGTPITTGSTYPITSSWANNTISASYAPGSPSISSSYALSASYAPGSPSISASYSTTASFVNLYNPTTGTYYKISISGSVGFETLQIG